MIFYFSGTGNSLYASEIIAKECNDKIISISDCIKKQNFEFLLTENESIGFCFPIYFYGLPVILYEFLENLKISNYTSNTFVYSVCTCGGQTGSAIKILRNKLKKFNFHLDSAFSVIMPDNYILMMDLLPEKNELPAILQKADKELTTAKEFIYNKKRNIFLLNKGLMPNFLTIVNYPFYYYGRKTKPFHHTEDCNGCGLCAKICPSSAIKIIDKNPVWVKTNCCQCLGCIHRCPKKAVQYGKKTYKRGRYTNPNCNFE